MWATLVHGLEDDSRIEGIGVSSLISLRVRASGNALWAGFLEVEVVGASSAGAESFVRGG